MKTAVQFGAGNIGRGFLGQLYFESGYYTIFIDALPELVNLLNERKCYPIKIVGNNRENTVRIKNFEACHISDKGKIINAIRNADIVSTAVGQKGIPEVIKILSEGVVARLLEENMPPLNVIICENLPEPQKTFYELIIKQIPDHLKEKFDENIGLVEASIGRMVPVVTEKEKLEDPLLIKVEEYSELPVDRDSFKGKIPHIKNMKLCSPFYAYVHRKLYLHNLTHATTAYLGALKKYKYIWEAIEDKDIRNIVYEAGSESTQAIHKLDKLPMDELKNHLEDLLVRYANKNLGDQIARVSKDPIRKLSPGERFIGAANYCIKAGIIPEHISIGIASALFFDGEDDESLTLREIREKRGVDYILKEICKISNDSLLFNLIKKAIDKVKSFAK
ncbi:MAG: mannitol dehydrogenase [Candidatus Hydrogenedentes bacterium]|nr:mannitol dehydrogenase [Candidatus Hydrogenedentota bacterium]